MNKKEKKFILLKILIFINKTKLFCGLVFLFFLVLILNGSEYRIINEAKALPFWQPISYTVGTGPVAIINADFNNDGINDMVTADYDGSTFSILLGNVNGIFSTANSYSTGNFPISLASADFDSDNKNDLVVANQLDNNVSVFFGNGDGTFGLAVNYSVGTSPASVIALDFNGDGKKDLAVANFGTNNVSILINNGDGTFAAAVNYNVGTGPNSVRSADFNNDTKNDLVVVNKTSNNVSILLGNGDGTFVAAVNYSVGTSPYSVTIDDFNNDGKIDLIANNYDSRSLSFLSGNGDGTFVAAVSISLGFKPFSIRNGDFNSDGKQDLAITDIVYNLISIFLGDGSGGFQLSNNYAGGTAPYNAIISDFNSDGKFDLATANRTSNDISIIFGIGSGIFGAAGQYSVGYLTNQPESIINSDFNNDGKIDIATAAYGSKKVSVLLGNGNGSFGAATTYTVNTNPRSVAAADFNNDGYNDLAVANFSNNNVSVLLNNGNGTFAAKIDYAVGTNPISVISADFNNDGNKDLAVANYTSSNVSILLGNGNGTFAAAVNYATGSNPWSITFVDFNNDGITDLATANQIGKNVSIFLGNSNGTFQPGVNYNTTYAAYSITSADFNGDNVNDLAVAVWVDAFAGKVAVLLNNGNGTFGSAVFYNIGTKPYSIINSDFNNDGLKDLAVANYGNGILYPGRVSILLGNGNGTFGAEITYTAQSGPHSLTSADFNSDTKNDLAVANYGSNNISIFIDLDFSLDSISQMAVSSGSSGFNLTLNGRGFDSHSVGNFNGSPRSTNFISNTQLEIQILNGDLTVPGFFNVNVYNPTLNLYSNSISFRVEDILIIPASNFNVGNQPESLTSLDFNGDNKKDLAVVNSASNNVSILLGEGSGIFGFAVNYNVGTNPHSISGEDFNGDSKKDLAVANSGSNNVSILLGNGDGTFGVAVNYNVGTSPYSVIIADFNGDNKKDLAVANYGSNNVSILLGNGNGTFGTAVNYNAGTNPYSIINADFNGDNKKDLAVANSGSNNVSILLGNGNGTFSSAVNYNAGTNPYSVTSADFNGDNKKDLALANFGSNNVSILLGNGDGTFGAAVNYNAGTNPYSVISADFNGDDKKDLAVANSGSDNISILLGNGDGTFGLAVNYDVGINPHTIISDEFNGDINSDLVVANFGSNNVSVLLGRGLLGVAQDLFFAAVNYPSGQSPHSVISADFNGDNKKDLAVANSNNNYFSIFLGNGNGTFSGAVNYDIGVSQQSIASADFDGDGKADLVMTNYSSPAGPQVSILLGNGDGTFSAPVNYAVGSFPEFVISSDFNNDSDTDLAVANFGSNNISILLGNGDGTFGGATNYNVGTKPTSIVSADFNGDNKNDLAVANYGSTFVSVLLGNGDGTFNAPVNYTVDADPFSIINADFNGDNNQDLVVIHQRYVITNPGPATISLLLGEGDGTFRPANQYSYALNVNPSAVFSADFNGDRKNDLAITNGDVGTVSILLGLGNGTFDKEVTYNVGTDPVSIFSTDFNGDNKNDLAIANNQSGDISILIAKQGGGRGLFLPNAPVNLTCEAINSQTIRWHFEDTATNETGFRLYGPEGKILDTGATITTDLSYLDETGLQPNTQYKDRTVRAFNGAGESSDSNTATCYTLANPPLPVIKGGIEDNNLTIKLDPNDGNPPETEYSIYEFSNDQYVQADGSFGDQPVWQTYEKWGKENGILVLDGAEGEFYALAINGDGIISGTKPKAINLSCQTLSPSEIEWTFKTASSLQKSGFRLYEPVEGNTDLLIMDVAEPNLNLVEKTEANLQPNTKYTRYLKTYNGNGESEPTAPQSCYTLANLPLPLIIGTVTNDSIQLIIDPNDGNPPETEYTMYDANSGKYVQADGSLGPTPVWQTYEKWGGPNGIFVKVVGSSAANVNAQFRISLNLADYNFQAQVRNAEGTVTVIQEKALITASKGVGINLPEEAAALGITNVAKAALFFTSQSVAIRLIQEFSFFLNIVLLILIILLGISLSQTVKNLAIKSNLIKRLKLFLHLLVKEPSLIFSENAIRDRAGTYKGSFEKHRQYQTLSQKTFKRTIGLLGLKIILMGFLIFGLANLNNYDGKAQGLYDQNNVEVKVGDKLSYIIEFSNQSQYAAKNLQLTDYLDQSLVYIDGSAVLNVGGTNLTEGITFGSNKLSFVFANLNPGESGFASFNALVKSGSEGKTITNLANIGGDNFDSVSTNQTSNQVLIAVVPPPEEKKEAAPVEKPGGAINQAPVASDDTAQTNEDTAVDINVLANDFDPDGTLNPQTLAMDFNPTNGTTILNLEKSISTYTPVSGFIGTDKFGYIICDYLGACARATVTIDVLPAPEKAGMQISFFRSFIQVVTTDIAKTSPAQQIAEKLKENPVIKTIAENKVVQIIQKDVIDNPAVESASQDIVTPTLVTLTVVNTVPAAVATTANAWLYLHSLFLEPFLILFRRKRKKWGIVYNALTKLPVDLAVVRLYHKEDNKLIQTKVTDKEGRYLMIVKEPGRYYLIVTKPDYEFPTKYLKEEKQDIKYLDLYHGEDVEVTEEKSIITANIPLDPMEKKSIAIKEVTKNYLLLHLRLILSYLGLILAILVLIIYPSVITITSVIVHMILFLTFRRLIVPKKPKSWGIVYDQNTSEPLNYAIVRILDTKFNKLLETQITDSKGRYAFLVGKNIYQLLAEKEGYQKKEIKPVDLVQQEEIVNLDVGLQRVS